MENPEELLKLIFRRVGFLTRRVPMILAALLIGVSLFRLDAGRSPVNNGPGRNQGSPAFSGKLGVTPMRVAAAYGRLPLSFEPNQGQTDQQVKFLARGSGYGLYLTRDEAVLAMRASVGRSSSATRISLVRMSLEGANAAPNVTGTDPLPGKSNYFIGNDPARWHRNIPHFARVRYRDVYPGIDLVYYGNQGKLEYDFEVAPGADPRLIALRFNGSPKLVLTGGGDLSIATGSGDVQLRAPRVYQRIDNADHLVAGKFALFADDRVRFEIGDYDRTRTLVIDPVLTYSTYLGGSGDESCSKIEQTQLGMSASFTPGCPAIAVDAAFRAYIAGATTSTDFPGISSSSYQACLDSPPSTTCAPGPNSDVFVARLNSSGTGLDYATYLGGTGTDVTAGIAVDQNFNVHVAGITNSANFPTSSTTAFQATPSSAGTHAFVSELDPAGAKLLYSTYLSGTGTDVATGLAVDGLGKEYVTGTTSSPAFPTSGGFPTTATALQTAPKATNQYFFTKLDPSLSGSASLLYSTYIGGSTPVGGVTMGGGIAVDNNCDAYLTGGTDFTDMPTQNAATFTNLGGLNAWVAKFSPPSGSACGSQLSLTYLTYFGGSGDDVAYGIAVDSGLNAYITGSTRSSDITFPTGSSAPVPFEKCFNTPLPLNPTTCPGSTSALDAFVAKFGSLTSSSASGTTVPYLYFSYLGGTADDAATSIVADSTGGVRIAGWTMSSDFPTPNAPSNLPFGGGMDAFVASLNTTATTACTGRCLGFSTFLGGAGSDIGTSIALDSQDASYVTGETSSTNFPVINAFQGSLNGTNPDAFVSKLAPAVSLQLTGPSTSPTIGVGNSGAFTYTITNSEDATGGVIFVDSLPSAGGTLSSISTSQGSCGAAQSGTVTCNIGTLNAGATATVTANLTPTAPATPLTTPSSFSNSASVTAPGAPLTTASITATLEDFNIAVEPGTPSSITVPAGVPASFTFQITGTNNTFPGSISLSAASGLPTATTTAWTTNPITSLTGSAQTSVLTVTTTARVTTTGYFWHISSLLYAMWLPLSGMAFLGFGIGGKMSGKKRTLLGLLLVGFFSLVFFQAGCGSKHSTSTTTGTPAGTYVITVDGTSGSASRPTTITLVVQ
jgi:hypothetical protein